MREGEGKMKRNWQNGAILVLVALGVGYMLGRGVMMPGAHAQGESRAGNVALVMGPERNGEAPVIVVDALESSLLIYEYDYRDGALNLQSARTFRYDRQLIEFNNDDPSVQAVRTQIQKQR